MAEAQFQKKVARRAPKEKRKSSSSLYRASSFFICTPIFWAALGSLVMTFCVFAFALTNAVLLAREDRNFQLQTTFSAIVFSLAASGFIHSLLHLWFGRFDAENKRQRLWLHVPLLLFFAAFVVHNVFWYLGVKFNPSLFPYPNSASYSIVGFVLCFIIAFSSWYQAKYVKRLYI